MLDDNEIILRVFIQYTHNGLYKACDSAMSLVGRDREKALEIMKSVIKEALPIRNLAVKKYKEAMIYLNIQEI